MSPSREYLATWIPENLRLSRKDKRFFERISAEIQRGTITSNQATLWENLVLKHVTQIKKAGITAADVLGKRWNVVITPSEKTARLTLSEDSFTLQYMVSWDKEIIREFGRAIVEPTQQTTWCREVGWKIPYTLQNLRRLWEFIKRYTPYCEMSSELLNIITLFKDIRPREWQVTAVPHGHGWLINNINESLLPVLPKSNEITITNIVKLVDLGIRIDPRIRRQLRARYGRQVALLAYERHAKIRVSQEAQEALISFCQLAGIKKVALLDFISELDSASRRFSTIDDDIVDNLSANGVCVVVANPTSVSHTANTRALLMSDDVGLFITEMNHILDRIPSRSRTLKYYRYADL